jgi:hypothetical protein
MGGDRCMGCGLPEAGFGGGNLVDDVVVREGAVVLGRLLPLVVGCWTCS